MATSRKVMTRSEFVKLAQVRIEEAKVLLAARAFDGAYYLCGYAVECALKACIAKLTREGEFPPIRKYVDQCYTHDLGALLNAAGLSEQFEEDKRADPELAVNWATAQRWSEHARYEKWSQEEAESLFNAITEPEKGVLEWIYRHW